MNKNIPHVLLAYVKEFNTEYLIKKLIGKNYRCEKNGNMYNCSINTKYYHAELNFELKNASEIDKNSFRENTEVFIITFDKKKNHDLDSIFDQWKQYSEPLSLISTKICLFEVDIEQELNKQMLINWCNENKFEFIEFSTTDQKFEQLNEYSEQQGINRLIELLEIHQWSNYELIQDSNGVNSSKIDTKIDEIFHSYEGYEDLSMFLNQLQHARNHLSLLEFNERSSQAEKLTKQAWKIIGGDINEIVDSD